MGRAETHSSISCIINVYIYDMIMSYGCKNAHVVTIVGPDAARFHGSDPWKGRFWCRSFCWFLMLAPLSHCQFLIGIVRCLTKALQRNILSNLCSSWLDTNFERERDWLLNPPKEHNRTRFPPSRTPHCSHAKELTRVLWPLRLGIPDCIVSIGGGGLSGKQFWKIVIVLLEWA